jgi:chromosome partitioning protein
MIVTLLSYKGGVGKTTLSIQLAAYLAITHSQYSNIAVVDGDPNQAALKWAKRGDLPFPVLSASSLSQIRKYDHLIIDSQARPKPEDIEALSDCDLLLLPTVPEAMSAISTTETIEALIGLGSDNYAIVLSRVPPPPRKTGVKLRQQFQQQGYPVFKSEIRQYAAYETASLLGLPVNAVKDRNAGIAWRDISALGEEVISYVS